MATQVKPNIVPNVESENAPQTEAETVKPTKVDRDAYTVMRDATIVSDKVFIKIFTQLDKLTTQYGSKWGDVIEHVKRHYNPDDEEERKPGMAIVFKSLLEMGKTPSSALSIRTFIFKMARSENSEDLEAMKKGLLSVRAARQITKAGKPEGNTQRSVLEKFESTLRDACKHGARLHFTEAEFIAKAKEQFGKALVLNATREANEARQAKEAVAQQANA